MKVIVIDNITQAVIDHGDGGKTHPRLYEIYTSLVKHLHAFVREVNLTEPELQQGRDFLTRANCFKTTQTAFFKNSIAKFNRKVRYAGSSPCRKIK
jgi:hypothetical protein